MAFSAHTDPDQILELTSADDVIDAQADQLAEMIRSAKHFVAFTGAGISTSAGIPDFRGPDGVWTRRAQGRKAPSGVSSSKAVPTFTHMALVAMATAGQLKLLISQNCDGLHLRSGFPPDRLAELHGNTNLELCSKCGRRYLRDYRVRTSPRVHEHRTGRLCPACGGDLQDSVVNFGESLPEGPLNDGFEHCRAADLVLCLGSSLTVTPAADMPEAAARKGASLVVCNLQKTPLDPQCRLRVFARTDDLMRRVCDRLGLRPPAWRLRRRLLVDLDPKTKTAVFQCVESDGTPATVFSRLEVLEVADNGANADTAAKSGTRRTVANFDRHACAEATAFWVQLPRLPCRLCLDMAFMGHYSEPRHRLTLALDAAAVSRYSDNPIVMEFDPAEGRWTDVGV